MYRWAVADVMTVDAVSVEVDTPFRKIVDTLAEHAINAVPVVDGDRRVVGIVSSADLIPKIEFAGFGDGVRVGGWRRLGQARRQASATAAGDLMSDPVVTVEDQTPVVVAARIMDSTGLKRLPVVDQHGRLAGMLTRSDMLKVFLRGDRDIRREIVEDVLPELLGVDPTAVRVSVDDGVVTLLGGLPGTEQVPVLVRKVARVAGVVDVVSHLTARRRDLGVTKRR